MKISLVLKRLFAGACVYYSAFSLALLLINVILSGGTDGRVIGVLNVLLLFPFSLALSGAEFLRKNEKLPGAGRMLLHYFIFTAAFLLFLWLPSKTTKNLVNALLMLFLVTVIYWLVFLICHFTVNAFTASKRNLEKRRKKAAYENHIILLVFFHCPLFWALYQRQRRAIREGSVWR